jgi:antitoxin YefM
LDSRRRRPSWSQYDRRPPENRALPPFARSTARQQALRSLDSVRSGGRAATTARPRAALVPIDEYDALEETAEILSDSETLAAIEAGLAELSRGEVVTLEDLRAELDERRSSS